MSKKKVYVSVPTNVVKRYCQAPFFNNLVRSVKESQKADIFVNVIDNSTNTNGEADVSQVLQINKLFEKAKLEKYNVQHLKIERDWDAKDPKHRARLFSKNLNTSIINSIRDFLASGYDYFVSLESDVTPPPKFIDMFLNDCEEVEKVGVSQYGIGGIYYKQNNVHRPEWFSKPRQFIRCSKETMNLLVWGVTIFPRSFIQAMEDDGCWEYMLTVYQKAPGTFVDGMCNKFMKDKKVARFIDTAIRCGHLHDHSNQRGLNLLR